MHLKLKIDNLDFTGLIPGLEAKKFDMVSVGLSPTPQREKAVSFSRAYVPYALILAVPTNSKVPASIGAWNSSSETITALEGSTDAQLATKEFPKARLQTFSDDTTALLQVATHRADAAVVEDYILAEFSKSNPGELKQENFKSPLEVQYGSYAVQKGNTALSVTSTRGSAKPRLPVPWRPPTRARRACPRSRPCRPALDLLRTLIRRRTPERAATCS